MLAVNRIRIVTAQATIWAFVFNLHRFEDRLNQAQKQSDTNHHHNDGEQMPALALQGYIAKSGGGQCGNGEIKRVDIIIDARVNPHLQHINQRRDDE